MSSPATLSVGIIGASGYTGAELIRILQGHPGVRLTVITSRSFAGQKLGACFPSLGHLDLTFSDHGAGDAAAGADLFFTALPHKTSMAAVAELIARGKRVIDLSADFRFNDPEVYREHYGPHSCPELAREAVYGLTEVHREEIAGARLVGNPGCYPTSALLPLVPLLRAGLVAADDLIIDSKSGVSGAGREATTATHFCEVNEGFRAYKVAEHRHEGEIGVELGRAAGTPVSLVFTPHLVPMARGILSTSYVRPLGGADAAQVAEVWREFYRNCPFVRVVEPPGLPSTAHVRGSNRCLMAVREHRGSGRLILISAIDNLVKGASGQAVQNLNRMMGWDESTALQGAALYP